jgi:outer membrane protein TolC
MNRILRRAAVAAALSILASGAFAAALADNVAPAVTTRGAGVLPGGPPPDVVWTIEQAVESALANHPLIAAADADTRAAKGRQKQAQSGYYPWLNGSTGYATSRAWSQPSQRSIDVTNLSLQASAGYTFSDFGRTAASVGRAGALVSAADAAGRLTRNDVAFAARVAFYNVLRAQNVLDVRIETGRTRQALLTQAQAYFDAGIRAKIDVARAEANLYQAGAELSAAQNDLRFARAALLERMGVDGPPRFALAENHATQPKPDGRLEQWMAAAEKSRPDLRAAAERVRAADLALRQAQANYNPILSGSAGYGYAADEFPLRQNYAVGVQLSIPIFNGYLTKGQVAEAEAAGASARYSYEALRRQVRLQVEQASLAIRQAGEQIQARKKQVEAARENERLATGRYEAGAGDIIEMIDAQGQATAAETSLVEAQYDYNTAIASLSHAIGE